MNKIFLRTRSTPCTLGALLMLSLVASVSHAEIYKWVDADGRTHYSEKKEDAGKAKALDLRVNSQPAPAKSSAASPAGSQLRDIQPSIRQAPSVKIYTPEPARPKSLSGGRSDDTDASRCNLARDVLSGAIKHTNGTPTDAYDRQIAENDIRSFCR